MTDNTPLSHHDLEPAEPAMQERAELEAALESARSEAAASLDRYLRARADADNVRKRAEADVQSARKYAVERFAEALLPVRDSLDLACSVEAPSGDSGPMQAMHEGVALTLKLMDEAFARFGLAPLNPAGEKFDAARHQAISMIESHEVPSNHIVTVVQKGFMLNDRLLRPAMVVVSRGAPAA